jgi:hypothetical protein
MNLHNSRIATMEADLTKACNQDDVTGVAVALSLWLNGSTGLHHFAGDVLQLCRAYGAVLRSQTCVPKSQRDSIVQPRVSAYRLPWVIVQKIINPNGVASPFRRDLIQLLQS